MFYGYRARAHQGDISDEGSDGRKTGSNHSGRCTGVKCGTLRDVHIACKSDSCICNGSGYGCTDTTALCAGSGRYMDSNQAEGADRWKAMSYAGLQTGLCICRSDFCDTSGTDKDECELILLGKT